MADTELECTATRHVFVGDEMGTAPWCRCGKFRNRWHRRSLLDRLLGRPRRHPHNAVR